MSLKTLSRGTLAALAAMLVLGAGAASGSRDVSSNITGVTRAAGETGAAAQQVLGAAIELSVQGEKLRGEVDTFLRTVRAA
jgi:methyl-accepting chemotaxis protein